jgi:meso-butanediol dehydrogenase/(S,S)-butanediol dehydrogenase/diacetyl reductase
MAERFEDKRVLITGAASGIGRVTAELFAREGAQVACSDIDEAKLAETVETVEKAGGRAFAVHCDVADHAAAAAAVQRSVDSLDGLDVLCNVAGILGMTHTQDVSPEAWNKILGVNLNGTFFMSQAALPHLLAGEESSIVNVASLAGLIGQAYCAAYCASKAGVVSLTKVMAVEFAKRGLRVNCVCPGGVQTPLIGNFVPPPNADAALLGRLGLVPKLTQPTEVAEAIAYLASAAARSISGVALPMDFGVTAA